MTQFLQGFFILLGISGSCDSHSQFLGIPDLPSFGSSSVPLGSPVFSLGGLLGPLGRFLGSIGRLSGLVGCLLGALWLFFMPLLGLFPGGWGLTRGGTNTQAQP